MVTIAQPRHFLRACTAGCLAQGKPEEYWLRWRTALTALDAVMFTIVLFLTGVVNELGGSLIGDRSGEDRTCRHRLISL